MRIVSAYTLAAAALALTSVARADAPAEAILKAVEQRSSSLTSFAGTLKIQGGAQNATIQVQYQRQPERFRLSIDNAQMGKVTFLNNGKVAYMQGPDGSFLPAPAELIPIKQIWPNLGGTLSEFVGGIESSRVLPSEAPAPGKPERRVVELVGKERTTRLYVNDDNQIEFVRVVGTLNSEIALENPSYNPTLEASLFELPKDAKIVSQPEARTLTVGSLAPGFTLKTPSGTSTSLARLAAGKKATLINFWATWCGPCREEMPALKKLHARLSPKGFQLISVNNAEDAATVKKFVAQEGFRFPVLLSSPSVLADYGVSAIPTNVLIDGKGKIVFASQGFDEAGLNAALVKLGLK